MIKTNWRVIIVIIHNSTGDLGLEFFDGTACEGVRRSSSGERIGASSLSEGVATSRGSTSRCCRGRGRVDWLLGRSKPGELVLLHENWLGAAKLRLSLVLELWLLTGEHLLLLTSVEGLLLLLLLLVAAEGGEVVLVVDEATLTSALEHILELMRHFVFV